VIDMRDDGEIADVLDRDGRHGGEITLESSTIKPTDDFSSAHSRESGNPA
jgi:hypothetical protein